MLAPDAGPEAVAVKIRAKVVFRPIDDLQSESDMDCLQSDHMTPDEFFAERPLSRFLFACVCQAVDAIGPASIRVTKSQIAFRRRRAFAWVWLPERHLHRQLAPLVLSLSLPGHDPSPRWKQVVEPSPGRFMHHLELYDPQDIDEEVGAWLRQAWEAAG